jgi:addiction module HigA family antidote
MRPIHPGEILREDYLVPLGMTPNALHVTAGRINDICRERWGVPSDTALRLACYFGGTAESWLNLQQAYDLKIATQEHGEEIARAIKPREPALA